MALVGLEEMLGTLHTQMDTVRGMTPDLLDDAVEMVRWQAVNLLSLTSHEPGTPTPSAPGDPPSMISGDLAASVVPSEIVGDGDTWTVEIGPTTVYGRIQELGGICGKGYKTALPPRPYMLPAVELSIGAISEVFGSGWADAF